jgi:hypothetical protein
MQRPWMTNSGAGRCSRWRKRRLACWRPGIATVLGPQKDRIGTKNRIGKPTCTLLPDFRTIIVCKPIVCKQGSVQCAAPSGAARMKREVRPEKAKDPVSSRARCAISAAHESNSDPVQTIIASTRMRVVRACVSSGAQAWRRCGPALANASWAVAQSPGGLTGAFLRVGSKKPEVVARPRRAPPGPRASGLPALPSARSSSTRRLPPDFRPDRAAGATVSRRPLSRGGTVTRASFAGASGSVSRSSWRWCHVAPAARLASPS